MRKISAFVLVPFHLLLSAGAFAGVMYGTSESFFSSSSNKIDEYGQDVRESKASGEC